MIRTGIMGDEASWGDDGNMEYWEELIVISFLFWRIIPLFQQSIIPLFEKSLVLLLHATIHDHF